MTTLSSWLFFLIAVLFITYPIGKAILFYLAPSKSFFVDTVLAVTFGLWIITIESFVLGNIGYLNAVPVFLFLQAVISSWFIFRKKVFKFSKRIFQIDPIVIFFIVLSLIINSLITFPFGTITEKGIAQAGAHSVDNNWHLSLINSLKISIPPQNPLYSGEILKNYHYLVDLQIAVIQKITNIPLDILYYRIIGPFYIFLYSLLAYLLGRKLTNNKFGGMVALVLISLSSNWYYITNLLYPTSYRWPSVAWVDYFSTKSVNYPLLFSMILLFSIIYLLLVVKSYTFKNFLILGLLIGSLISFKSHTGIVFYAAFGTLGLILFFLKRSYFLLIFILSMVPAVSFLFFTLAPSGQTLIFYPFWFIKTMYEAKDRLNFDIWELKRQYLLSNGGIFGLIRLYLEGIFIFLLTNLGFMIFGSFAIFYKEKIKTKIILWLLFLMAIFSFVFTMAFIYRGVAIITIQFFYIAVVSFSFLTTVLLTKIYNKFEYLGLLLSLFLWISFLPGVFYTLKVYSSVSYVTPDIASALVFLSNEKEGTVLVHPAFTVSSVVSAYSKHPVFYADEIILSTLSINYIQRKRLTEEFFKCESSEKMKELVVNENISYIFSPGGDNCLENQSNLKKIYGNDEVRIFKVI